MVSTKPSRFPARHFEGRQELAPQQSVAPTSKAILRSEFDRATPDDQFAVTDVDIPPAGGTPLGRHVVRLPPLAHEEDQGFTGRTAGVVAGQRTMAVGLQALGIAADVVLGEQGQRRQVSEAAQRARLKAQSAEQFPVIGNTLPDIRQKRRSGAPCDRLPGARQATTGFPRAACERPPSRAP
jgi:hypothetical protein